MAGLEKEDVNNIKYGANVSRDLYNGIKKHMPKISNPFKMNNSGPVDKSGDDNSKSGTNQLLAVLLGCGITGVQDVNISSLKKKISKEKTLFGKVEIISNYVEELQKKEKEEKGDDDKTKNDKDAIDKKEFYTKLTEFISGEGSKQFSNDFCKLIEGVTSLSEHFTGGEKKEEEKEKTQLDVVLSANDNNAEKLVENVKDLTENKDAIEKLNNLEELTSKEGKIQQIADNMGDLAKNTDKFEAYKGMAEKMEESNEAMKTATDKASKEDLIEQQGKFEGLGEVMLGVAAVALILVGVGLLADKINFGALIAFAVDLAIFLVLVGAAVQLAWDDMDVNMAGVKAALILVAGSALVMLLGGAIMKYVDIANLTLFTITLSGFLLAIGWALWEACLDITAKQSMYALVVVAGAALIMFLGAAIVPLIDIGALAQFTIILSGFLLAIGVVLKWVGKAFTKLTKHAVWALVVVAGAALIMFLGAAIMPLVDAGQLVLFVITLSTFLLAIAGAMWVVGKVFNQIKKEMLWGLVIVAGAALIMFLGAAIMPLIDKGQLVLFTVTLSLFLLAIAGALLAFKPVFKEAKDGAKDAAILVALAGATLLIGGLVMKLINPADITIFTVLLDILLLGVSLAFRIVKDVKDMEEKAMGMLAVIGLGGLMMLAGGLVISKFPDLLWAIPAFTLLLSVMLGGIALTMVAIGKFEKEIEKGEELAHEISTIIGIGAASMLALGLAVNLAGGPMALLEASGIFVLVWVAIGGLAALLGAMSVPIAAGAAAMIVLSAAMVIASGGLYVLAKVMMILKDVPKLDSKLLIGNVQTIVKMAGLMAPLALQSPLLLLVAGTMLLLAKAISAIAESVGDIANLKIAIEWDPKTGRPTKYKELKTSDFENAGKNVGLVVSTLTEGIMKVYDSHKDWFESGIAIEKTHINPFGLLGKSPLEKVISQSAKLGKLISAIADGLKDYADLKFPIEWDSKTGRPIKYKAFTNSDFENAAENIKLVVTTLTLAIMQVYEDHKDDGWFDDSGGFLWLGKDSPLEKVISQSSKLQKLISSIAEGLKDYADLKFAIEWDPKTGKPIKYKNFENKDFKNASDNIIKVVSTLSEALMQLYEDHPEWYSDNWFVDSSLVKVIKQSSKLENLMSSIAHGVKAWAAMQIPDQWDPKTGKPVHFKDMKQSDPEDAANNVKKVVSSLSEALMDLYDEHPEWYDTSGGFLWLGTDSPLEKVIGQSLKISQLMSGIAQGVKAWATMQVPDKWDPKTGKPISFRDLKPEEPMMAGINVATIVTTLADALTKVYDSNSKMFEDEGGFLGIGSSNKFTKVLNLSLKLSELMSGIAQGVKAWALMQVPEKWDPKTGKPIAFRDLKPEEPTKAAENVVTIVTMLGEAIMKTYTDHKPWFEDKSIFATLGLDIGATPFSRAINANIKLSSIITSIAEGLQSMAELRMPIKWDKEGKPIDFKHMSNTDIEAAGKNVSLIVSAMGNALMDAYGQHMDWFEDKSIFGKIGIDMGASPFSRAVNANVKLGELMTNIAMGLQQMAQLNMPTAWDDHGQPISFKKMGDDDMIRAGVNVGTIISVIGNAIMDAYNDPKKHDWFETEGLWGWISGSEGTTPFMRVVSVNLKMAEFLTNIAKGLQEMAKLRMPIEWNADGAPINFVEMQEPDFVNAGKNVGRVIEHLGTAMIDTYNAHPDWYTIEVDDNGQIIEGSTPIQLAINSNQKMGELLKNMAEGIKAYSELDFAGVTPDMTDDQKSKLVASTFSSAAANIQEVCTTVATALMEIATNPLYAGWFTEIMETTVEYGVFSDTISKKGTGNTPFGNVVGSMSKMGMLIKNISEAIQMYASMQIPGPDGKSIPLPKGAFKSASEEIKDVIITVGAAIMAVYEENPEMFGGWTNVVTGKAGGATEDNPFSKVCTSLGKMSRLISTLSESLAAYASQQIPIAWDKEGKPTAYQSLTEADMLTAGTQIGHIVSTLGIAIGDAYKNSPEAFETKKDGAPAVCVVKALNDLVPFVGRVGQQLGVYAAEKVMIWDGGHDAEGYKTYKPQDLTSGDITNATDHIKQIILAMAQAVNEAYTKNEDIFESGANSPAVIVAKAIDKMGPMIAKSAEYVGEFNKKYVNYGLDSALIDLMCWDITTVLRSIATLYVLFGSDDWDDYNDWGIAPIWKYSGQDGLTGAETTFKEVIDDYDKFIRSGVTAIKKAFTSAWDLLCLTEEFVEAVVSDNQYQIFKSAIDTLPVIVDGVTLTVSSVKDLIQLFGNFYKGEDDGLIGSVGRFFNGGEAPQIGLQEFEKLSPNINRSINTVVGVITNFTDKVVFDVMPRLQMLAGNPLGTVFIPFMELIYSFRYAIQALGSEFEDLDSPFASLSLFKGISDVDDLDPSTFLGNITMLAKALREVSNVASYTERASIKGFIILSTGISLVAKATAAVKNTKEFSQQTKQLGKYVKSINSVKLENLRELYKFVNSVNKLAAKMGNLDKLTDALGKKLAGELKMLTKQLKEAQKTIDKAEKMQDKRKRQIDDSIKKIETMMKEHMVVDIVVDGAGQNSK